MAELHGQQWWNDFFESSQDGIYTADLEGNLLATNPGLQKLLGYSAAELTGVNVLHTVTPEDLAHAHLLKAA